MASPHRRRRGWLAMLLRRPCGLGRPAQSGATDRRCRPTWLAVQQKRSSACSMRCMQLCAIDREGHVRHEHASIHVALQSMGGDIWVHLGSGGGLAGGGCFLGAARGGGLRLHPRMARGQTGWHRGNAGSGKHHSPPRLRSNLCKSALTCFQRRQGCLHRRRWSPTPGTAVGALRQGTARPSVSKPTAALQCR